MNPKHKTFLNKIKKSIHLQPQEVVSITDVLGRVLSENIRAKSTSPFKDIAAIDGYAIMVNSLEHIPATLEKIGESTSGRPFAGEIKYGQAVKVSAGAVLPIATDTVVPLAECKENDNLVTIEHEVVHGENICFSGIDFTENEVVLKDGDVISARSIGLSAAMKVSWLPVRRKPRIGILSIGDELTMPGENIDNKMHVTSSSSLSISAVISACGAIPVNLGIAMDSSISLSNIIKYARGVDLLVTTGGLSNSANNLIKKFLSNGTNKKNYEETTLSLIKEEVVLFGIKSGIPVLSLPGNPISAQICSILFLKPIIIEQMLNIKTHFYKKSFAILNRDLDVNDKKMDYIFGRLTEGEDKQLVAIPASSYDRMLMSSLADSDCLITVNPENAKSGSPVEIIRFVCSALNG